MTRWVQQRQAGVGVRERGTAARLRLVLAVGALALLGGCRHAGPFVWVDEVAPEPEQADYVILRGDTLSVRVWGQDGMSARARVREDGKISLPFLHDVQVVGYTPPVLAQQL